jgi:AcrR family transcriptional regulator
MERGAAQKRPAAKRKRAEHLGPERRRPLLLDAALALFLEHGYDGTSMQAVADRAGVTKPVVYSAFESKDRLFRSLLAREEERILTEIGAAFEDTDLSDPERAMTDGFTGFLRAVDASPDFYRLIFLQEGGGNAAVAGRFQRGRQRQVEALTALARSWLTMGEGKAKEAEADRLAHLLGESLVALGEAGARTLLGDPKAWTPESLGETLGRLAAQGQEAL